jgi:hypothetical protein
VTAAAVQGIASTLRTLAEQFDALLVKEPTKGRAAVALVDQAPGHVGDLAAWFATLTPEQLRNAWVPSLLSAMQENEWSYRELALTLRAVRDHPNVEIIDFRDPVERRRPRAVEPEPAAPPYAMHSPASPSPVTGTGTGRRPRPGTKGEAFLIRCEQAAPKVGDEVVPFDLFPDLKDRVTATHALRDTGDFDEVRRCAKGQKGGGVLVFTRRRGGVS